LIRVGIEQEPPPSVIDDQVGGIALDPITRTNFNDFSIGRTEQRKDVEQDSVLSILRVTAKFDVQKLGQTDTASCEILVVQTKKELRDLSIG
jgi:hypothetical protein